LNASKCAVFELHGKAKTTAIASYGADFQRGQGVQKQCNGMRSVATHKVTMVVRKKLRIHAVLPAVASGQLPFLGLLPGEFDAQPCILFCAYLCIFSAR
jgi:hypothetical protein